MMLYWVSEKEVWRMKQYSFTCPLDECGHEMRVTADHREEALDRLTGIAADHLEEVHPEVRKTDAEIRQDLDHGLRVSDV